MKYGTMIGVGAFIAGYVVKCILTPSTPSELLSSLEKKITRNPIRYEEVIDRTREFSHSMKVASNPHPTKPGYVQFKDIRLALREYTEGDLTVLVNTNTGEALPIQYNVEGRTAVGTYSDWMKSLNNNKDVKENEEKTKEDLKEIFDN